jgi:hypothetical protein
MAYMRALFVSSIGWSILVAGLMISSASSAAAGDKPVTPYGDHSRDCTIYGTGNKLIPLPGAIHGLTKYYEARGYTVGAMHYRGRFIEAEIFRDGRQVDKVLFDRISGRVRSIY